MWNKLPLHVRNIQTLEEFKLEIKPSTKEKNILYYYGKRWPCVHHSLMRIGCSKLKFDLCNNLHVINETHVHVELNLKMQNTIFYIVQYMLTFVFSFLMLFLFTHMLILKLYYLAALA